MNKKNMQNNKVLVPGVYKGKITQVESRRSKTSCLYYNLDIDLGNNFILYCPLPAEKKVSRVFGSYYDKWLKLGIDFSKILQEDYIKRTLVDLSVYVDVDVKEYEDMKHNIIKDIIKDFKEV